MLRAIFLILMMGIGNFAHQTWLSDEANYIETFQMVYWSTVTAIAFWGAGLLKTDA